MLLRSSSCSVFYCSTMYDICFTICNVLLLYLEDVLASLLREVNPAVDGSVPRWSVTRGKIQDRRQKLLGSLLMIKPGFRGVGRQEKQDLFLAVAGKIVITNQTWVAISRHRRNIAKRWKNTPQRQLGRWCGLGLESGLKLALG